MTGEAARALMQSEALTNILGAELTGADAGKSVMLSINESTKRGYLIEKDAPVPARANHVCFIAKFSEITLVPRQIIEIPVWWFHRQGNQAAQFCEDHKAKIKACQGDVANLLSMRRNRVFAVASGLGDVLDRNVLQTPMRASLQFMVRRDTGTSYLVLSHGSGASYVLRQLGMAQFTDIGDQMAGRQQALRDVWEKQKLEGSGVTMTRHEWGELSISLMDQTPARSNLISAAIRDGKTRKEAEDLADKAALLAQMRSMPPQ